MKKFIVVQSKAASWLLPNIDTDIITPMKRILLNPDELADYAFEPYRFLDGDGDSGKLNPSFVLNMEEYTNAEIMIVGDNFGSGSSRETAPEAIAGLGIRCLIGTSFGGIFFKNCFQQGILPIVLPQETVQALVDEVPLGEFKVDLQNKVITTPSNTPIFFQVGDIQRQLLLQGLDSVGLTLKKRNAIVKFETDDKQVRPWIYGQKLR